jgi:FtsH-binding integral membrane protein
LSRGARRIDLDAVRRDLPAAAMERFTRFTVNERLAFVTRFAPTLVCFFLLADFVALARPAALVCAGIFTGFTSFVAFTIRPRVACLF